jgi:hypothetical protein
MKPLGLFTVMVALFGGLGCGDDCPSGQYDGDVCIPFSQTDGGPAGGNDSGNDAPAFPDVCDESGRCPEPAHDVGLGLQALREERKSCASTPLVWDEKLANLAQTCTQQMSRAQNTEICKNTLGGRLLDLGIPNTPQPAELYAKSGTVDGLLDELEGMRFVNHYLDDCSFTDVAVGLSRDESGWYWLCLVFR